MKLFKNVLLMLILALFAGSIALASVQKDLDDQLMKAVVSGNTAAVKGLIAEGANVNAIDKFGYTSLIEAVDKGYIDIIIILIDNGATTNSKGLEEAFVAAAYKGNTEVVKVLISKGVSISSDNLETAYMLALNRRNTEMIHVIKDHLKSLNTKPLQ